MSNPILNVADAPLRAERHGERFAFHRSEIGEALGLTVLGCMLHVVPPGKTAFPYHRHHARDEMFFIVAGEGEYRIGESRLPVRPGDCLGAPAGGEAHQIVNTGSEELRYLGLSNNPSADLIEYPDSGKIGMRIGSKGVDFVDATYKARGRLTPAEYWDGEE
ncbi:MAG TPA: cupin domain-containing protein [Rhizomicrobium sp.]|jgi:uncharacterized cupin superfamily protein